VHAQQIRRHPAHTPHLFQLTVSNRQYFVPVAPLAANGSVSGPFSKPYLDQFGNLGRNSYFGPSFFNTDMSLLKNIPIHENIVAQFRVDAFNILTISPLVIQAAVLIAWGTGALPEWR